MSEPYSGLAKVAAGVALLFLATTVLAGVWGGMQLRALQASRAEQVSLDQQLAALRAATPSRVPSIATTTATAPAPGAPPPSAPAAAMVPPVPEDDPMASISGDPMLDAELMQQAADRVASSAPFFEQQPAITPEKRADMEELLQLYYAKQIHLGSKADENDASAEWFNELSAWFEHRLKAILTSREHAAWKAFIKDQAKESTANSFHARMAMLGLSMSTETRERVIDVMWEEMDKAAHRVGRAEARGDLKPDLYVRSIAVHSEYLRCTRERLAASLTPKELEEFDLMAGQLLGELNQIGDRLSQSMDEGQ